MSPSSVEQSLARGTSSIYYVRTFCGLLIGISVAILGAYWIARMGSDERATEAAIKELELRADGLAAAVTEQTRGTVHNLDLALLHLSKEFARKGRLTEDDVESVKAATPFGLVRQVTLIDRQGRAQVTYPAGGAGLALADRPHFSVHSGGTSKAVYIGVPIRSRIDPEWVIPVSRRVVDPNGKFAGVIAVMVRPEYFSAGYISLARGAQDVIALMHRDGAFLSRSSGLAEHLGKPVRSDRPFVGEQAPMSGTFRSISTLEPVDRIFAFRRLEDWPLVAVVGMGIDDRMASLRQRIREERTFQIAVSGLVAMLVGGICLVVLRLERSLARVRESDQRRAMALEGATELAWEWDVPGNLVRFFGDGGPFFGRAGDEWQVPESEWRTLIHAEDRTAIRPITRAFLDGRSGALECRYRYRFADGNDRWVLVRGRGVAVDSAGRVVKAIGILLDIDADRKAELSAERTQEAYRRLVESAGEGIFVVDREGLIRLFNPAAERLLGWDETELIGKDAHQTFHCGEDGQPQATGADCPLRDTLRDGQSRRGVRVLYRHRDGRRFSVEISISAIRVGDAVDGAVVLVSDISRQLAYETELERLARTDGLTSLWNRRYFVELVERELRRAGRDGTPLSLLMVDIDHFKEINDRYGHAAGDAVLVALARHFEDQLREVDLVSRLGGEEFGVGLPGIVLEEAMLVAERVRHGVEGLDVVVDGAHIHITVSIGVTQWEKPEGFDSLLGRADDALYEAKNGGRNRVIVRRVQAQAELALPGSAG